MRIKAADSSDVQEMHAVSIEGREILIVRTGQVVNSMGFLGLQPSNVFTVEESGGSIWIDL